MVPKATWKCVPPEFSYKSLLPKKFHASYKVYVRKLREQGFETDENFTSDEEEDGEDTDKIHLARTKPQVSKVTLLKQFFDESGMSTKEYKRIAE